MRYFKILGSGIFYMTLILAGMILAAQCDSGLDIPVFGPPSTEARF